MKGILWMDGFHYLIICSIQSYVLPCVSLSFKLLSKKGPNYSGYFDGNGFSPLFEISAQPILEQLALLFWI